MPRVRIEGLWPDDEQLESNRNGAHFRMTSGREYVVSSSLLAGDPDILRKATVPFTRYIDEHPEDQPVVFTTNNTPRILSRPPIPFSERAWLLARAIARRLEYQIWHRDVLFAVEAAGAWKPAAASNRVQFVRVTFNRLKRQIPAAASILTGRFHENLDQLTALLNRNPVPIELFRKHEFDLVEVFGGVQAAKAVLAGRAEGRATFLAG